MGRFLVRFSYFGTRYSGLQRQPLIRHGKPVVTVQGAIEDALKRLRPTNDAKITLSSRTDKGVHSLRNAFHVNLEHPEAGKEFDPRVITNITNFYLKKEEHDIRVLETYRVSDNFHARLWADERRYIYRLAHSKRLLSTDVHNENLFHELMKYSTQKKYPRLPLGENLSIADSKRMRAFREELDINKLCQAAEMLSGVHNFSSFTTKTTVRTRKGDFVPHPVKLLTIGVKRGAPFAHHMQGFLPLQEKNLEFWDVHVRAKSFLYRQVRRLVGAMVLVSKNLITLEELQDIVDNPKLQFPFSHRMGMDECGLYLVDVLYKPQDLEFDASRKRDPLSHGDEECQTDSTDSDEGSGDGEIDVQTNSDNAS